MADGVGSWRQFGVDPRQYSHRLVENARCVVESDQIQKEFSTGNLTLGLSEGDVDLNDMERFQIFPSIFITISGR